MSKGGAQVSWDVNMSNSDRDLPNRSTGKAHRSDRDGGEEWPATRVLARTSSPSAGDDADASDDAPGDIGHQTAPNEFELFVSCDPAPALQQQFEFLRPKFIAVHDIGTTSSRKLLTGVASAGGRAVQRLVIRRQGYGTALATLRFVELPTNDGPPLRMYTTDCETESNWRSEIAYLLLAHSRLGVVMVGDLQPLAIGPSLRPLRESITGGSWPNRHLLLLPLTSANNLVSHGMELARGTPVNVRTAPQVARPADAWGFISGSWGRANERANGSGTSPVVLRPLFANGKPAAQPAPVMTRVPAPAAVADQSELPDTAPGVLSLAAGPAHFASDRMALKAPSAPGILWEHSIPAGIKVAATAPDEVALLRRYARQVSEIAGVGSCCVFDIASGNSIAYAGTGPGAATLAAEGAALMSGIAGHGRNLKLGETLSEAAITLGLHHLLVRAVPLHSALGLIAVLDRASANLTMVRLQVLRLDAQFEEQVQ
jgi:hypothetical protein